MPLVRYLDVATIRVPDIQHLPLAHDLPLGTIARVDSAREPRREIVDEKMVDLPPERWEPVRDAFFKLQDASDERFAVPGSVVRTFSGAGWHYQEHGLDAEFNRPTWWEKNVGGEGLLYGAAFLAFIVLPLVGITGAAVGALSLGAHLLRKK